jgi:hypothetical protein
VLWIDRDVPTDPTITFTRDDCDWVVRNDADLDTFRLRIAYWAGLVGLPLRAPAVDRSTSVVPISA